MTFDQRLADRQSKSRAFTLDTMSLNLPERLEDVLACLVWNTGSMIADPHLDKTVACPRLHLYLRLWRRELCRVAHQIDQHLRHPLPVCQRRRQRVGCPAANDVRG